jgi:intracellular septation protein
MSEMSKQRQSPLLKLALDLGPLILFFAAFKFGGIFAATAVFMAASVVSLGIGYAMTRKISPMPLVTAIIVLLFGGLTLYLKNDTFIKMKPTVLYAIFGAILLGGLAFNRPLITYVLDAVFNLTDEGWRKLTLRWGLFFLVLAGLNEIVWRNFSTDFWVSFKVFGTMPLTFLFAASQVPLLMRYEAKTPAE